MTGDRVVGFACRRSGRGKGCTPITEADMDDAHDYAWLHMTERVTQDRQTPLAPYRCPGGCGGYVPDGNQPCITCWLAARTYEPAQVRMLPRDDPRRQRVRDPRDRRRREPWFGRAR